MHIFNNNEIDNNDIFNGLDDLNVFTDPYNFTQNIFSNGFDDVYTQSQLNYNNSSLTRINSFKIPQTDSFIDIYNNEQNSELPPCQNYTPIDYNAIINRENNLVYYSNANSNENSENEENINIFNPSKISKDIDNMNNANVINFTQQNVINSDSILTLKPNNIFRDDNSSDCENNISDDDNSVLYGEICHSKTRKPTNAEKTLHDKLLLKKVVCVCCGKFCNKCDCFSCKGIDVHCKKNNCMCKNILCKNNTPICVKCAIKHVRDSKKITDFDYGKIKNIRSLMCNRQHSLKQSFLFVKFTLRSKYKMNKHCNYCGNIKKWEKGTRNVKK